MCVCVGGGRGGGKLLCYDNYSCRQGEKGTNSIESVKTTDDLIDG